MHSAFNNDCSNNSKNNPSFTRKVHINLLRSINKRTKTVVILPIFCIFISSNNIQQFHSIQVYFCCRNFSFEKLIFKKKFLFFYFSCIGSTILFPLNLKAHLN